MLLIQRVKTSFRAAIVVGASVGLGSFGSACFAQEGVGVQILGFSSVEGELSEDMKERMSEGAASFSFSGDGGGFSMGSMFGGVNPNDRSQLFGLLDNESVRSELKLSEQQYAGVKQIMKASQKNLQSAIREMIGQGGGAIRIGGDSMKEVIAENQAQAEAAIEEILLPEQMKRVQQLAYQIEISKRGLGECLVSGQLGEEIGVHDDQKQHLTDVAERVAAETAAKIATIKAQAMREVLAELAPEQRKKAEELLGEYFDYKSVTLEERLQKSIKTLGGKKESEAEKD
jgi:hypothetical protein